MGLKRRRQGRDIGGGQVLRGGGRGKGKKGKGGKGKKGKGQPA